MATSPISAPTHGGRILDAAAHFGIPEEEWLDLSTGISPFSYPVPPLPGSVWQCLPDHQYRKLLCVAYNYYGSQSLLAAPGSQFFIETLPRLRPTSKVAILSPTYQEYAYQWSRQGHHVLELTQETIERDLEQYDVLVVVRPNNPTTEQIDLIQLRDWQQRLAKRGGWLIVDEAFIEPLLADGEPSLITPEPLDGLIVLRSVGKFFGLAGIRLGFIWSTPELLAQIEAKQLLWHLSGPTVWAGIHALQDRCWQSRTCEKIRTASTRLQKLLQSKGYNVQNGGLYCYIPHQQARTIYESLAQRSILVRLFEQPAALRIGLPAQEADWQRLSTALSALSIPDVASVK